jgi:hypothetical protein
MGYSDADWASQDHRHSISAYVFQINSGRISWSCQKQSIVALSSTEAEFIVLTHTAKEAVWLKQFITEVFQPLDFPMKIFTDNQSSITIVHGNQLHMRTKHFNIQLYFIRDTIKKGNICVKYFPTGEMVADILTKPLPGPRMKFLNDKLGIH